MAQQVSNGNLYIYDRVREVPETAKKTIGGGRLRGMTDINPMWRIKILTEVYGPAGSGWYYEITSKEMVAGANNELAAFVDILLYVKNGTEWSKPILGTGGSKFIAQEKDGLYTNDEAFKMALTDALSVACKALGIGADVYWDKDRTKYDTQEAPTPQTTAQLLTDKQVTRLYSIAASKGYSKQDVLKSVAGRGFKEPKELPKAIYDEICETLQQLPDKK